jgi:hypothetical protein
MHTKFLIEIKRVGYKRNITAICGVLKGNYYHVFQLYKRDFDETYEGSCREITESDIPFLGVSFFAHVFSESVQEDGVYNDMDDCIENLTSKA